MSHDFRENANAQFNLGKLYDDGQGVPHGARVEAKPER
jgi:TPR repeat protein